MRSAATEQEQAVIAAARAAVISYPFRNDDYQSDIDWYMGKLRDALEALDAEA